jgi:O-antigen ligase
MAFLLGLAVFLASPPELTADFLRIPFTGSYIITYFDLIVLLSSVALLWRSRLAIAVHERGVYAALGCVIASRGISLIFAGNVATEQVISVLRYFETFVLLLVLSDLLSSAGNRLVFLRGLLIGALIDSTGALFLVVSSRGESRGFWLGVDTYKILDFLLIACCISLSENRDRAFKLLLGLWLMLGILATGTRAAVLLFLISLLTLFWTRLRAIVRPALILLALGTATFVPLLAVFPQGGEEFKTRMEQLWTGGGTLGLRFILWEMAGTAYLNHPVTGIGSGGFSRQQNALYYKINDVYAPEYENLYEHLSTHNTILGIAAETGTVGLIAYCVWLIAVLRLCLWGLKAEKTVNDPFLLAACVTVIAMLTQDFWGQASFIATSSSLIGFIMGCYRSSEQQNLKCKELSNKS